MPCSRIEHDGARTVLAVTVSGGKRLNSPNDVVVTVRRLSIWFTDPSYGIDSDYEGEATATARSGAATCTASHPVVAPSEVVASDFEQPNGLAFSADEGQLYVADTREKHLRVFDVDGDRLRGGRVLAECSAGSFDGLRLDDTGRIWAATHDGVHVLPRRGRPPRQAADPSGRLQPDLRRTAAEPRLRHRDQHALHDAAERQRPQVRARTIATRGHWSRPCARSFSRRRASSGPNWSGERTRKPSRS